MASRHAIDPTSRPTTPRSSCHSCLGFPSKSARLLNNRNTPTSRLFSLKAVARGATLDNIITFSQNSQQQQKSPPLTSEAFINRTFRFYCSGSSPWLWSQQWPCIFACILLCIFPSKPCHPQIGHLPLRIIIFKPIATKNIAQKNPQKLPVIMPNVFSKIAKPIAINKIPKNIFL